MPRVGKQVAALPEHVGDANAHGVSASEWNGPAAGGARVRFALVIPALNEEQAIGPTLQRALDARAEVVASTPIDQMYVVFVNDGSTDGTQAIADRYPEVINLRFERNRGYGAAIQAGFRATDAELVGFMDADGTCDPRFCANLINRLYEAGADVALGARLNADSQMPLLRRLGNWVFARLVGIVSGQPLTDAASGMRVIRRTSLRRMAPLPDGLHFTPAMSCVATLDPRLRIEEVPMPYKERVGRSKLNVIKDGVKFLMIILFAASCYSPIKVLAALGLLFSLLGALVCQLTAKLGAGPWVVGALAGSFAFVFLQSVFIGVTCHQLNYLLIGPRRLPGRLARLVDRVLWTRPMVITGLAMLLCAAALWGLAWVAPSPWRLYCWIASAACVAIAGWVALGGVIFRVIWAARERQRADWQDPFEATNRHRSAPGDASHSEPAAPSRSSRP